MVETVITSAVTALIVSAIWNKVSAVHTFNVIDGYVKDIIEMTKNLIKDTHFNE